MSNMDVDQHMMDIFDFKRRIGKGAYGIVWKAVDKRTKEVVAVKKIFDAFKNKTDAQRTYREITFLRAFGIHKNIIKLKGIHKAVNNMDIYLVFEYMDTDLHNAISQGDILTDVHKRYVMYQLLNATKFIHSGSVVHRDQKPSNILLDKNCRCKLADFGLARSLTKKMDNHFEGLDNPLTDYVATRWYRPPEVLVASKRYTHGIDMWSLGCILAEMLLGKAIFPGTSTVDQVERILSVLGPATAEDVKSICSSRVGTCLFSRVHHAQSPLKDLLRGQPADAVDLVSRLLVLNPEKRLSAQEALKHPYVQRFHEEGPTIIGEVVPLLPDEYQWSIEQYRSKLYEIANNETSPRYEELSVPVPLASTTVRSHSQSHQSGGKHLREKSSSHHGRRPTQDHSLQRPVDPAELRRSHVLLPPVEAATQQSHSSGQHRQCRCKKVGSHRNNMLNATCKVPQVVPQGPKLRNLNKPGDKAIGEGDGKHLIQSKLKNTTEFLPQAASTPRAVPFNDALGSHAMNPGTNHKQMKHLGRNCKK